jgi:hypothetical protein
MTDHLYARIAELEAEAEEYAELLALAEEALIILVEANHQMAIAQADLIPHPTTDAIN